MKIKSKLLFLRVFSALLCFHFLNISVKTHKHFLLLNSLTNSVIPSCNGTETLLSLMMQAGADIDKPENNKNASDTTDGEEEEKKCTDDDFFSLHFNSFVYISDQNAHRFHGVSDTQEFISEINPPPPKG